MEVEIFERKFNYLSDANNEKKDSLFYYEGEKVAKLEVEFNTDNINHKLLFHLTCRGEVKILNKITGEKFDQDYIRENIKDDKELLEKIYKNKNIEIILGNGFYITCKLDDNEEINIDNDCYDIEDLKILMNSPKKIFEWYKFAIEEQD